MKNTNFSSMVPVTVGKINSSYGRAGVCGTTSYFPPLLQMQVALIISFISSSGSMFLPGASLERERESICCSELGGWGCKLFS